jgi:hypothetical protein
MKYPKKRYVQGVRPAHIVFSVFFSPRLKAWDVGMSKYTISSPWKVLMAVAVRPLMDERGE